eukprot:UC1_evm2s1989
MPPPTRKTSVIRRTLEADESGHDRSYYHGRISRDDAVERLTSMGVDGSFLLRMSESQEGVYTVSVMQGAAVRHIRVINTADGGYCLSKGDPSCPSVWSLIDQFMNTALTNTHNSYDAVALRFPLEPEAAPIAPDLLVSAGEMGMNPEEFDADVAAFLEGGVSSKALARRRSMKAPGGMHQDDMVREAMKEHGMEGDPDLERFMNGKIDATELQRRRADKVARGEAEFIETVQEVTEADLEAFEAAGGFDDNFTPGENPDYFG